MNEEIRERIFTAANDLYEQNGRNSFPTVDAVRKAARVNMSDASSGMREWRRSQSAQTASPVVQVPDAIAAAGMRFVAELWQQAQEQASESLRAAQAGWEAEKEEIEAMRVEVSEAFELQAVELEAANSVIAGLQQELSATTKQLESSNKHAEELRSKLSELEKENALAVLREEAANQKSVERQAELKLAQATNEQLRQEREQARNEAAASQAESRQVKAELERSHAAYEQARSHLEQAQAQAAGSKVELAQLAEKNEQLSSDVKRLSDELAKVLQQNKAKDQQYEQAKEEAAVLKGRLEQAEKAATTTHSPVRHK